MKGLTALALLATVTSCVSDVDAVDPAAQEAAGKENAELQLGLVIPEGQTWDMSTQITADVAVNLKAGETYDVAVYANDPLKDGTGMVLTKGTINNGETFKATFTGSKGAKTLYVGVTDKNNFTRYKLASVEDDKLYASFGSNSSGARSSMRAISVNGTTYEQFTFPTDEELAAIFPTSIPSNADGPEYLNDYNVLLANGAGHNYKITTAGEYNIGGGWMNTAWVNDHTEVYRYNVYVAVGANETVTLKRQGDAHFNLYILSGNVTLDMYDNGEISGIISVASGATLNDKRSHIASNYGTNVYNRGTYNATNTNTYWNGTENTSIFDLGNNCTFYNEGTFNCPSGLSYSPGAGNASCFVSRYDNAVLTASSMTLNSECHFYTEGTVNITNETFVTQNGIVWVNNGHYTTGSLIFSAGNGTFYNYCQLKVTGNTTFTDGWFNLMPNSYTEMGTGLFDNFVVNMYDNSGLYIKNGSKWGRQGQGEYYGRTQGFRAVDDATAYVRLGGSTQVTAHNDGSIHFNGENLTYAIEDIKFYMSYNSIGVQSTYDGVTFSDEITAEALAANQNPMLTFDPRDTGTRAVYSEMAFTEPEEGECAATWEEDGEEKIEEPVPYTFAFEDQIYNGDYDMNDVVLKITPHVVKSANGKKITAIDYDQLDIKLVAAGATFNINAYVGETPLFDGQEIHNALGVNQGVMVNTGQKAQNGVAPVTSTIDTPVSIKSTDADGNTVLDFSQLDVWIWVNEGSGGKSEQKIRFLEEKEWPYAVMIPNDWAWPVERTCVTEAYPGTDEAQTISISVNGISIECKENSFSAWAATIDNERSAIMKSWFNYPATGKVINNQ